MIDLRAIMARAATRLALMPDGTTAARPASWLIQETTASQVATLATPAKRHDPGRYALSRVEADVVHADPWDDATIARFQARDGLLRRLGFVELDAEDLALRLHLRDVHADYRHLCLECVHYRPGRCLNHVEAVLPSAAVGRDLATTFQHCSGFAEAAA